jgi:hypothetical protein
MARDGEHFFCFYFGHLNLKVLFSSAAHFFIDSLIWGEFSFFEFPAYSGYQSFI